MVKTNNNFPSHNDQLVALRRIEGQIRGIAKMINQGQYCVDVINQIQAATQALGRVSEKVFERHLHHCVASAVMGRSNANRRKKVEEVLGIIRRMRS